MQVGADAFVIDVIAPPARAPERQAPAEAAGQSFEDHLAAASSAPDETRAEPHGPKEELPAPDPVCAQTPPPPSAPPEPPARPALIQVFASLEAPVAPNAPQNVTAEDAPVAPASAQTAPQSSPAPQAPPLTEVSASAPPQAVTAANPLQHQPQPQQRATDDQRGGSKKTDAVAKPNTGAPKVKSAEGAQPKVATAAPAQSSQTEAAPQPAPPAVAAVQTPPDASLAAALAPVAPAPAANVPAQPPQLTAPPPVAPRLEAKGSSADTKIDSAPAKANAAPKTSPPAQAQSSTGKDGFASLLAQQADNTGPASAQAEPNGSAVPSQASAIGSSASIETAASHAPPAAAQVGREIVRRFNGGTTNFEMRLDPPELGRVDVRLEVSRDNKVTAIVSADSQQTLNELSRHARDLEQALNSAGLELSDDGLRFDLSDQRQNFAESETAKPRFNTSAEAAPVELPDARSAARPVGLERWRGVRVDLVA